MNASYGVKEVESDLDIHEEELKRLGFTIIDSGLTKNEINEISNEIERCKREYDKRFGFDYLKSLGEHNGIRKPLSMSEAIFRLCFNPKLISYLDNILSKNYILNQQNVVINPVKEEYNQSLWHRDLPYQHYTSSRPLAVNALFCVDDFTLDNGSTWVIPGSHKEEVFPSKHYLRKHACQVKAKSGSFILLDCMLYHKGGSNNSNHSRKAINHVFTSPMIAQQIKFESKDFHHYHLTEKEEFILSINSKDNSSVESYLFSRE
ncbi:hypothetical protein BCU71_19305 [Vibrio lentus]|uniref:phytanoyl-CoA dioxygenase family protein n=1 Tax=Vibrio lentus TaxID=136468 RepID=UPI000C817075|nr:phytanoyl-CoA dioxygenase family protein [Vibrio lentus]PMH28888.1 hypothetical protein BCU71_19305 [Vibrio lentus]PMK68449.1 hypothetical protein BCT93_18425 [Vibrio lentus]